MATFAGPLTPADVQEERATIPSALAAEKAEANQVFQASRQFSLACRALEGISRIEDSLSQVSTNVPAATAEMRPTILGEKRMPLGVTVIKRIHTTTVPTNGFNCYLDAQNRRSPELYLDSASLKRGVNVLVPKGVFPIPSCLQAAEVDDYLIERIDRNLTVGAYWNHLHSGRIPDEELARLRYYDYLDTHTPLHSVPVYQCTEIRGGTR
jgi:hypothetical protein